MKKFITLLLLLASSNSYALMKKKSTEQKTQHRQEESSQAQKLNDQLNEAFYNFPQDLLKREINRDEWNKAFRQILDLVKKSNDKSLEKLSIDLMTLSEDILEAIKNKKIPSTDKTLNEKLNALAKYMKNGDAFISTKNKITEEEKTELEQRKKLRESGLSQNEILLKTKDIIKTRIANPIWLENSDAAQVLYNLYNRINDLVARYTNALLRQAQQK